jgi:hypothetical protein
MSEQMLETADEAQPEVLEAPEVDTPGQEAEVASTEAPAAAPAAGAVQTGAAKPSLPEGVVSPIAAQNHLKQKGLVPADAKPQVMYGFVKAPGKGEAAFPVKHYAADGTTYDAPQVKDGVTITRPGVLLAEVENWWHKRAAAVQERKAATAAKAQAAAAKAAAPATASTTAQADATPVDPQAGLADGEVVEAE